MSFYTLVMFSAFKVHHQHKAIAALLLDEKGNTIPFAQFKKAALKISDHQNKSWLKTEYNTAKRRAAIGAKFTKFKETAHLYPNLKWTPSRSNNPDGNHQQLWGITLPVEHPFWASNFPGNRWNCKCGIQRTKAATTGSDDVPTTENPPKGLDGNPAFTKEIIAKSHPVFKGLSKAEEKAALKVVTKQVKKDVIEFSTQLIKDKYGSIILTNKKLSDGKLTLRRGVFKTLGAKVTDPFINTYPLILQNDIQNWEYLGYAEIEDENKHLDAYYFSYYKTSYGGRTIYINVKDTIKEGEVPYNILYRFDKKKVIEKKLPKIKRRFVRKR